RVSGAWLGEQKVTLYRGGEEFAPIFEELQTKGLLSQFGGTMTQSGNSVTATLDIDHTGAVCSYSGTIDGDSLRLTATSCAGAKVVGIEFPDHVRRDLVPGSVSLLARISSDRMEGFAIENDSVVESGTSKRIGNLNIESSFTMTRR
ncbi:MAG: hypothetical protein ACM3SQ_14180, partial [Betaproteobacteria bacterium]